MGLRRDSVRIKLHLFLNPTCLTDDHLSMNYSKIQTAARSGKPIDKPRWPLIILRTPKGLTGPLEVDGKIMTGSFHAHQVPLPECKKDAKQLADLKKWLSSYEMSSLLTSASPNSPAYTHEGSDEIHPEGLFTEEVLRILPKRIDRRMGMIKETYNGYTPLDVPDFQEYVSKKPEKDTSPMKAVGLFLQEVIKRNPTTFRIFSPDGAIALFHDISE